ncbi:SDR family oxidoreductase [Pedobacter sp. BMA]|uniref:SDR family NAD(P)-dependent oxidoreductase n=1 Tax=Pedobacter sp. BMA TaxID=1663685 RepID=UPI00064AB8B0|nr:SDR family oxidoreductase [Pedobacter sp. BMA]KLT65701.1 short-chain dehydrogenase [Pedobacter sp. BMA]
MEKDLSQKTFALVTGASKGLGKSFAIELAKKGYNLALIARSEAELAGICKELSSQYGIKATFLAIDLAESASPETVLNWISENYLKISVLINNAGYGLWGNFSSLDLSAQMDMCRLNMDTVVKLCHLFIPRLLLEKEAYILNVSSTAAYQAVPTLAIYSATKSFILSFTRALRFEHRESNLSITCLSPGPVDTGFAHRAGLDAFSKMAEKFNMKPNEVAKIGLNGLFGRKSEVIPGFTNLISVYANRVLPKFFIEKMAAGIYKT